MIEVSAEVGGDFDRAGLALRRAAPGASLAKGDPLPIMSPS